MFLRKVIVPGNLLRAAFLCTGKKDPREFLNGILITPEKIISSDGFMLFHATYHEYCPQLKEDEMYDWRIQAPKIIRLLRKPNAKTSSAIFDQTEDDFGIVRFLDWRGTEIDRDVFFIIDDEYPDVSGILQCQTVATEKVSLNPDMVAKVDNVFNYANGGGNYGHVTFNLKGEDKAPFFTQEIPGFGELIYLSMPIIIRKNFEIDEEDEKPEEVQEELS